ncbi:MAG: 50S ribosomal protein L4 [Acidobacteriota bacterium]|nr:MAG: 50S ribosomal protein L4 [Acidobacteriota bacterium]
MAEVEVKNLKNKVVGKLELSDEVFNYEASRTLVWEAVNAFLAAQRKGTHATKNRSAVRGGGQKPWRQKGTGRARVGTTRSPLWAGGGTVHGPQPRDYTTSFPKKKRRGAMRLVLTDKLKSDRIVVLEDLNIGSHKTKDVAGVLATFAFDKKVLVVDSRENRDLYLGSRNIPRVKMVPADGVNVYDLVNHDAVMISKAAILELQEVLKR